MDDSKLVFQTNLIGGGGGQGGDDDLDKQETGAP